MTPHVVFPQSDTTANGRFRSVRSFRTQRTNLIGQTFQPFLEWAPLLQIPQRRPGGLAAGVAADHAAALLPAALAFDLVGGGAVLGHAPGHAHPPAVAAEELPIVQPRGPGDGLDPPGDLRLRQPEHLHLTTSARRPDGGKRPHGGGGDGHHGALGLGVGLGAYDGDAARSIVPALDVAPGQRGGLGAAQSRVGEHGHQGQVKLPPLGSLRRSLGPTPAFARLHRGEPDDGEHVGGEGAGLALGFREAPSPSLQRGAHARVPAGGLQLRPLVGFRDGRRGQPDGGDAGAGAGPGGQVAGHGEGLRRQSNEPDLVAPAGEDAPLGPVDAAGVVGEDRLQGVGHALVGSPQLGER